MIEYVQWPRCTLRYSVINDSQNDYKMAAAKIHIQFHKLGYILLM